MVRSDLGGCEELALKHVGWECDEQRFLRYEALLHLYHGSIPGTTGRH
jgi:hypothetical protein